MAMLDDLRLHQSLIGRPGSRAELNTPALVIDRDALDRNIRKMADLARAHGVALRPHAKTHKSVDVAQRQIAAGAVGICCAKLGEAEALAASMSRPLHVLIDIDPGTRRTGVPSAAAAVQVLNAIRERANLRYRGVQMYCGRHQHIASYQDRADAIRDRMQYLQSIIAELTANGGAPEVITGGGTGTHYIDASLGVLNESQVGSYVFMDRQYTDCDLANQSSSPYEYSLFVDARVVSANTPGMATIDAGYKAFATDGGAPVVIAGAPQGSVYNFMGDEHGAIVDPEMKRVWNIADIVRLAVPHCDPTVNLYDAYHVVVGDTLVDIWPVTARGRSR